MKLAATVEQYLAANGASYRLVSHPHTPASTYTAEQAHICGDRLAKAVILEDEEAYLMVVIPSTYHVELTHLRAQLHRDLGLATESELASLFPDCERGAIPPLGPAYGLETFVDDDVAAQGEIYFEAGNHEELVRMDTSDFLRLLGDAPRAQFGHRMDPNVHHAPPSGARDLS